MISQKPERKRIDRHIAVRNPGQRGFTLVELVAVLAMLALLAAMVPLGMARSRTNGREVVCLSNVQRLMGAAQMYAEDNAGRLPGNVHGGEAAAPYPNGLKWAVGWLDWGTRSDNTNIVYLTDDRFSSLARYLQRNPRVFKCPSDNYLSPVQQARGWTQRVRSYSASIGIGEGNAETGPFETVYRQVRKTSEFIYPSPAETWVYTEEHPDSMNDPAFFSPRINQWIDLPAGYHDGGGSFAFTDGHAETHRWTESVLRLWRVSSGTFTGLSTPSGDRDIRWMRYHTSRVSPGSY
jgi:prepilin-type N-terminal cleavage/methylation domain-containing protein/prepilin-type processing-associated H-X9-DG protein